MVHAFKANDIHLEETAKQLLFWSRQWSDSSSSATDGSFDVGPGKTLRIGDFPSLDQSAHVVYTGPQALSWRPSAIRSQVGPGSRLLRRQKTADNRRCLHQSFLPRTPSLQSQNSQSKRWEGWYGKPLGEAISNLFFELSLREKFRLWKIPVGSHIHLILTSMCGFSLNPPRTPFLSLPSSFILFFFLPMINLPIVLCLFRRVLLPPNPTTPTPTTKSPTSRPPREGGKERIGMDHGSRNPAEPDAQPILLGYRSARAHRVHNHNTMVAITSV